MVLHKCMRTQLWFTETHQRDSRLQRQQMRLIVRASLGKDCQASSTAERHVNLP